MRCIKHESRSEGGCSTVASPRVREAALRYYDVSGDSLSDIRDSLNEMRPTDYDAEVDWKLEWKLAVEDVSCNARDVVVGPAIITVSFPRLVPPTGPSAETIIAIWNRYIEALAAHEAVHVGFVIDAVAPMQLAMEQAESCEAADLIGLASLAEISRKHEEYDAATDHGRTEGAQFR